MPGGNATKPGDVVTAMNGRTIEVINTDAEGRLVLADALCVGEGTRGGPDRRCGDADRGGHDGAGRCLLRADDEQRRVLLRAVEAAAVASGEKTWRLPMFKEYDDLIKSDVADIKNVAAGNRGAGTIVGAKFLEPFVGDTPWVHLDIAGVDNMSADKGWISKGASGYSVRTMVNLAVALAL